MGVKLRRIGAMLLLSSTLSFVTGYAIAADAEIEFKKAMAARNSGNLEDSIVIFESILSQEPLLHRARLELAVAYFRATQFEEAERNARKVLADPKTPASVRLSIIAFLAKIKSERKRFEKVDSRYSVSVSAGYLYDTNVNVGPSSDVINIGTATLRLGSGSKPQGDGAITLSGTFNYSYQTGKTVNVGGKTAAVLWQSQASIYSKQYEDLSEFNLDVLSLSTGIAFVAPGHWRSNVSLRVDSIELGSDALAFYTSLLPSITWQLNKTTDLSLNASLVDRDYKKSNDEARDSVYKSIGVTIGKRYLKGKLALQAGLTLFNENADNDRFSRDGTQVFLGANWQAWKNGSVYINASQRDSKHDDPEPLFNEKRDERLQRFELGFRHQFTSSYLDKWLLKGSYSNTDNASNIDIYTYDREVTSVTFSRDF